MWIKKYGLRDSQKTNSNNGRNDDYSKNDKIFNKKADANDIIDDFSEEYVVPGINFNDNNSEKEGFPSRRAYTMPLSKLFSLFHKYVLQPELLSSYVLFCTFIWYDMIWYDRPVYYMIWYNMIEFQFAW